ncbi:MAG: hypothetical protein IJT72_02670 [Lachnospiraceae bacterium]|nr:hypothetical protein [Lachnospiraceae bacterium]
MAVTDLLKNGLADITGTVEKAIVMICDESLEDDLQKKEGVKTKTSSSAAGGLAGMVPDGAVSGAMDAAKNAAEKGLDELKETANEYASLAGIKTNSLLGGDKTINYNREFSVQFNPSSMQLSARKYSEKDLTKGDATQNNNNINMASPYPDIVFSVTLLFERVVAEEAFLEDTRFRNISTIGRNLGKFALDKITGGFETVQNMVDGFIGAIRNKRTRRICFAWNNMRYEGILNGVNSKYTMFDLYGRPIRGEVRLTIRLSDMQINDIDMGYWQDAYDKAFGFDDTLGGTYGKLKNLASQAGNYAEIIENAALQTVNIASQLTDTVGGLCDAISTAIHGDDYEKEQNEAIKKQIRERRQKHEEDRQNVADKKVKATNDDAEARKRRAEEADKEAQQEENQEASQEDSDNKDVQKEKNNETSQEETAQKKSINAILGEPYLTIPMVNNSKNTNGVSRYM